MDECRDKKILYFLIIIVKLLKNVNDLGGSPSDKIANLLELFIKFDPSVAARKKDGRRFEELLKALGSGKYEIILMKALQIAI